MHGTEAAACVTVKTRPAMVRVPTREAPVLAATLNVTEPVPLPLTPEVTVSQVALLVVVQTQPRPADTETLPVPPDAAMAALDEPSAYVHDDGGSGIPTASEPWVTVAR